MKKNYDQSLRRIVELSVVKSLFGLNKKNNEDKERYEYIQENYTSDMVLCASTKKGEIRIR